ncbi:MAG: hypothetical protein PHD19_03825 [Dechloromonas sp.]|jgi:hypothetical protein|uniref:hypothetical protein n=1 Tax=Azonexus sp. TaxID=1872668 RepID=UPI0035ADC6F8|nr:hypothetical protein [Dechloromonas sp.]
MAIRELQQEEIAMVSGGLDLGGLLSGLLSPVIGLVGGLLNVVTGLVGGLLQTVTGLLGGLLGGLLAGE